MTEAPIAVIQVALAPRVRPKRFAEASGITLKAIQHKIARGKWVQGREYYKDPDGLIWIDVKAVMAWVG